MIKTIRWGTCTSKLEGRTNSFCCTSRVLIVMNELPQKRADVMAIMDRCDAVHFAPTKKEIIARMRQVFPKDAALINLIEKLAVLPSLRTLIKARKWQLSTNLNVVEELLSECGLQDAVYILIQIMSQHPEREWCHRYIEETGMTDRTFRRHKKLASQVIECWGPANPCPNVLGCVGTEHLVTLPDNRTGELGFASNSIATR